MVKMVVGEVQIQTDEIKEYCNIYITALEGVIRSTTGILFAFGMTGDGMDSIKKYISSAYPALCKATILHAEETISANEEYLEAYTSKFGSKDLDSDELEEQIRAVESVIGNYEASKVDLENRKRSLPNDASAAILKMVYQNMIQMARTGIDRNQEKKAKLEKKLQDFLDFSKGSTSYFEGLSDSASLVSRGMQALGVNVDGSIGAGSWNGAGFSMTNTSWIKDVQEAWKKRNPSVYGEPPNYGGNQSSPVNRFKEGDSILIELLKKHGISDDDMEQFLMDAASEGCGYMALVNSFFHNYRGTEAEFEAAFGFPMYTIVDGMKIPNTDYLFVDLYATTDNHNSILGIDIFNPLEDIFSGGTSQETREYRYAKYLKEYGMEAEFTNGISVNIENYDKYKGKGDLILSVYPVLFENEQGNLVEEIDAGHAVTITGATEDGRLIVSSWGGIYYVNPDSYKDANNFSMQLIKY